MRWAEFGCKVALVGCVNAAYLLPLYRTVPDPNPRVNDEFQRWTLGHLPAADPRLWAALAAAYCLFGAALWLLHREFRWYTAQRQLVLSRFAVQNYTALVSELPLHLQSVGAVRAYFEALAQVGVHVSVTKGGWGGIRCGAQVRNGVSNEHSCSVFFEDLIVRWTRGGRGTDGAAANHCEA